MCYLSCFEVCFIKLVLPVNTNICLLCNKNTFSTVVFFSFHPMSHLRKLSFLLMPKLFIQVLPAPPLPKRQVNSGEKHAWEYICKQSRSNFKPTLNKRCGKKSHTVMKAKIHPPAMNTSSLWLKTLLSHMKGARIYWTGTGQSNSTRPLHRKKCSCMKGRMLEAII